MFGDLLLYSAALCIGEQKFCDFSRLTELLPCSEY